MQTQAREAWGLFPDLLPQPGPPTLSLPGGGGPLSQEGVTLRTVSLG